MKILSPMLALGAALSAAGSAQTPPADAIMPGPTAADWVRIGKLPDLSGSWSPDISDQNAQVQSNPVPWKPEIQKHGTPTFRRA